MNVNHRSALVLACLLSGLGGISAALADPVTYAGKLGNTDIVVEFTDNPAAAKAPVAGRYFYRSKGVDIPLLAKSAKGGRLELSEEEPCSEAACPEGKPVPIASTWRLASADKGKTLSGVWSGKQSYDIKLSRVASRENAGEAPKTPFDLYDFSESFYTDGEPITETSSPYDFLRLDVPLDETAITEWGDVSFRYVSDPRTKFPSPRLVKAGATPVDAANAVLKSRHWWDNRAALSCVALKYAGFFEDGAYHDYGAGSLGGYEDSDSQVLALTPRLMSWRESGSIFCGGAHPDNYSNALTMDVGRGLMLDLADMFLDVVDGKPGETLVAFVKDRREKPTEQTQIDFETECGTEDLIGEYLGASLKQDGDALLLVFGLQGLPHAIMACGDDVLELPVADAAKLFTPEFAALLRK